MSQATQRVGQYNFLKKLGAGRMAEVFLGRIEGAEGFQKPVAIKKILADLAGDLQFVQSLIAEAKVGGQLHHRNIVEVYDFIRYGSDYCIIMEYVDGVDLSRILRSAKRYRVRIPPAAALYIASQVCDGLDYAHSARGFNGEPLNIIHRDLKPSNVLISIKGGVKISDFGIARVMDQVSDRLQNTNTKKTSFQYQSPEQATGSMRLSSVSDVFSVGVIFFEMLTLEPLFSGKNVIEAFEGMREGELQKRLSLAQRQLPGSEKILATALNPNPSERYRSAGVMAEDLRRLLVYMKVDDPRERLVTFFARLVRFVQEQGKKPDGKGQPSEEDWDADTSVDEKEESRDGGIDSTLDMSAEEAAQHIGDAAAHEQPVAAPQPNLAGDDYAQPQADQGYEPELPPSPQAGGYDQQAYDGHAEQDYAAGQGTGDTTGQTSWESDAADVNQAPNYSQVGPDEHTPVRPPSEETKVGTYETVAEAYSDMGMEPPEQPNFDSTRIIPAQEPGPPPPIYEYPGSEGQGGGAYDSTRDIGQQDFGDGTAVLPDDYVPEAAGMKRRARLPLVIAGLVGMLALGGGGLALYETLNNSGDDAQVETQAMNGQTITCPTCGRRVACAPYCAFCGAELNCEMKLDASEVRCQACNGINEKGAKYCAYCGKPLGHSGRE